MPADPTRPDDGTFDPTEARPTTDADQSAFFEAFLDGEIGPAPDAAPKPAPKPAPKVESRPEPKPKIEAKPKPDPEPDTNPASDPESVVDQSAAATDPAPEPTADPEPIAADAPVTVEEIRELFGAVLPASMFGQAAPATAPASTQPAAATPAPAPAPAPVAAPSAIAPVAAAADPFDITEDEYNALWSDNGRGVLKTLLLRAAEHGARVGSVAAQERMAREFPALAGNIAIETFQRANTLTQMYAAHPELVPFQESGVLDAMAMRIRSDHPEWTPAQRIDELQKRALAVASRVRALRAAQTKAVKPSAPARPGGANGVRAAARRAAEAPTLLDQAVDEWLAAQ